MYPNYHLLQSEEWSRFNSDCINTDVGKFISPDSKFYFYFEKRVSRLGLAYLYIPYGPINDNRKITSSEIESIYEIALQANVCFVRLTPFRNSTLDNNSLVKVKSMLPEYTTSVNLKRTVPEILSSMSRGHRSRINSRDKKPITVQKGTIENFLILNNLLKERKGITSLSDDYYKKLSKQDFVEIHEGYYEGKLASSIIIYKYRDVMYYAHGANDYQYSKQGVNVILLWKIIEDNKDEFSYFDLFGIAPPDNDKHPLKGISVFKNGFGGETIELGSQYELPVKKGLYKLHKISKAAIRKIVT